MSTFPPQLRRVLSVDLPPLVAAVTPALFAALHAPDVASAAFDADVVRVLGLDIAGPFRLLDVLLAAPFQFLPLGTRAFRAALLGACLVGVLGALLQRTGARLLRTVTPKAPASAWMATVGSLAATLSLPVQVEATGVGGHLPGALLVLAPAFLASEILGLEEHAREDQGSAARTKAMAPVFTFVLGIAAGYGAVVLGSAAAALAIIFGTHRPQTKNTIASPNTSDAGSIPWRSIAIAAIVSLLPVAAGVALQALAGPLKLSPVSFPNSEVVQEFRAVSLAPALDELGTFVALLGAAGAGLGLLSKKARPVVASLAVVAAFAVVSPIFGVPTGPSRYGAVFVAGLSAATMLAACAMHALVRAVVHARLAFAEASAVMMVVLFLALPVRSADDTATALGMRPFGTATLWDLLAFGQLPPGSVLFVQDARIALRLEAGRASGAFRDDVAAFSLSSIGTDAGRAVAAEPALAPFVRELLLSGAPDEFALSSAASVRPILLAFDPRWERSIARHLVPSGLFDRYEASAVVGSDRRPGLQAEARLFDRLARAVSAPHEEDLRRATALLLRRRLFAALATNDRETAASALSDLLRVSPPDALTRELERRLQDPKGRIDLRDVGGPAVARF